MFAIIGINCKKKRIFNIYIGPVNNVCKLCIQRDIITEMVWAVSVRL